MQMFFCFIFVKKSQGCKQNKLDCLLNDILFYFFSQNLNEWDLKYFNSTARYCIVYGGMFN